MARLPRLYAPSIAQHVAQRAADGRIVFVDEDDYAFFTALLGDAVRLEGLALHAYVLLPTQVRLLATPPDARTIGRVMQFIGRRYVPYLNRKTRLSGSLWDRRYRSTLIDADAHLLEAMHYIERRAIDEGLVTTPENWRWSSHAHHVGREQTRFINDHQGYWGLSDTPFERQARYQALAAQPLEIARRAGIESSVDRGWVHGESAFVGAVANSLNRRGRPLQRGRRRKIIPTVPN